MFYESDTKDYIKLAVDNQKFYFTDFILQAKLKNKKESTMNNVEIW